MSKILKWVVATLVLVLVVPSAFVYFTYGGGKPYPDVTGEPVLERDGLEVYFKHEEPIGNVAATRKPGVPLRVFFTIHPESRPEKNKVVEITGRSVKPFPDEKSQSELFITPLGVYIDNMNRLWVIDHGNHGTDPVRLTAFDLGNNSLIMEHVFSREVAEKGSFFNDLTVSPDGRFVYISDVSFWRKNPALIVFDVNNGKAKRFLEDHPSVKSQGYVPVTPIKMMRFFLGLADLLVGIDGIDTTSDGSYVYYAAMSHGKLFRIPTEVLNDFSLPGEAVEKAVESFSDKPLSDGIRLDDRGNVYITDIEHQGITVVDRNRELMTLVKDDRIRWADGLSLGNDGYVYLADSAIPVIMLQSKEHIRENRPYYIFRFRPPYDRLQ